jgi:hypothetical protein
MGMSDVVPIRELARRLSEDAEYRRLLTQQIEARAADQDLIRRLVAYARERQATTGHAVTRQVLTDAGVSWEA